MIAGGNYELVSILFVHRNDDLFMERTFGSHFDARFGLTRILYDFLYIFNFLSWQIGVVFL